MGVSPQLRGDTTPRAVKRPNLLSFATPMYPNPSLICCSFLAHCQQTISKLKETVQGLWFFWPLTLFNFRVRLPFPPFLSLRACACPFGAYTPDTQQVCECVHVCMLQTNHLGRSGPEGADQSFCLAAEARAKHILMAEEASTA